MATSKASSSSSSPHGTRSWLSVARAYNLCDAVMSTRLAELGLRLGDHEVLVNLAGSPGMTQKELAARCFVAKSGISMLLTQMENQGWVLRQADSTDARMWRLSLTAAGRALAARCMKVQSSVVRLMIHDATEAELTIVAEVMDRMSARLEAQRAAAPQASARIVRKLR
jgi:DNA-binding MarR family transcriptional regulator